MKNITNRFGTGNHLDITDLEGHKVLVVSTACMSVTSDIETYIQSGLNDSSNVTCEFVTQPAEADDILVLGCQVTDLSILNDIRTAEEYHQGYPNARVIMGGCLAYRFDIEIPDWCQRIGVLRKEGVAISEDAIKRVTWKTPFWTDDDGFDAMGRRSGDLFRNYYPIKIGAGCHGKCKYCTIRDTRGGSFELDAATQVKDFLDVSKNAKYEGVVLISDSPSVKQIKDWCHIAEEYNTPLSFRNVEPQIANACADELRALASAKLLKVFHCPIQSNDESILAVMNRNVPATLQYIELAQELRKLGVYVATNIIIDYVVDGNIVQNLPAEWMDEYFDYWVWNPYFDGNWDREKAELRFAKYIQSNM